MYLNKGCQGRGVIRRYLCPEIEEKFNICFSKKYVFPVKVYDLGHIKVQFSFLNVLYFYSQNLLNAQVKHLVQITIFIKDAIVQMKTVHVFWYYMMKYKLIIFKYDIKGIVIYSGLYWYAIHKYMSNINKDSTEY